MLYQGGEREKIHTLEIGGHVQMAKSDHGAQRKSLLSDCTWLENEYGSFNLEALKFLMHFREPGSSLYLFIFFLHILIFFPFFSSSHTHIFFFFSFSHFFFFFLINFFSPL
jgi:hypothetical protein